MYILYILLLQLVHHKLRTAKRYAVFSFVSARQSGFVASGGPSGVRGTNTRTRHSKKHHHNTTYIMSTYISHRPSKSCERNPLVLSKSIDNIPGTRQATRYATETSIFVLLQHAIFKFQLISIIHLIAAYCFCSVVRTRYAWCLVCWSGAVIRILVVRWNVLKRFSDRSIGYIE